MDNVTSPVLQVRGLTKFYGSRCVVNNVSFDVMPGEIFGFLGPNGCGKTTTIKMILGLISMNRGTAAVCGHDVHDDYEKAAAHFGGIIENPEMYKYMTGRQNLECYAAMYDSVSKERIDEVTALVGLTERINDKVSKYSLGMRQRLGVAQAILPHPSLLVLDEPTNGLDPAGIKDFRELMVRLAREENVAVFISSHLLSELELFCDKVAIVDHGTLLSVKAMNDIHRVAEESTAVRYITTDDIARAESILSESGYEVSKGSNVLSINVSEAKLKEAVKLIVLGGVGISEVRTERKTLEDAFFEVTEHSYDNGGMKQ
jgi:ABC-2 type transport system ATP-binding protein